MTIYIEDLKFLSIIGILDFERVKEQEIIVNVTIDYNYKNEFINYALVSEFIKTHIIKNKFLLIEDALESLIINLKNNFPLIEKLHIKLTKPSIMDDCIVSVSNTKSFKS